MSNKNERSTFSCVNFNYIPVHAAANRPAQRRIKGALPPIRSQGSIHIIEVLFSIQWNCIVKHKQSDCACISFMMCFYIFFFLVPVTSSMFHCLLFSIFSGQRTHLLTVSSHPEQPDTHMHYLHVTTTTAKYNKKNWSQTFRHPGDTETTLLHCKPRTKHSNCTVAKMFMLGGKKLPLWYLSIKRNRAVVQKAHLQACWGKAIKKNPTVFPIYRWEWITWVGVLNYIKTQQRNKYLCCTWGVKVTL